MTTEQRAVFISQYIQRMRVQNGPEERLKVAPVCSKAESRWDVVLRGDPFFTPQESGINLNNHAAVRFGRMNLHWDNHPLSKERVQELADAFEGINLTGVFVMIKNPDNIVEWNQHKPYYFKEDIGSRNVLVELDGQLFLADTSGAVRRPLDTSVIRNISKLTDQWRILKQKSEEYRLPLIPNGTPFSNRR